MILLNYDFILNLKNSLISLIFFGLSIGHLYIDYSFVQWPKYGVALKIPGLAIVFVYLLGI